VLYLHFQYRRNASWRIALAMAGLLFSFGCGQYGTQTYNNCVVNSDQQNSFRGHWQTTPVPVAVFTGGFDSTDQASIGSAISTWNAFSTSSKGYNFIQPGGSPIQNISGSNAASTANLCSMSVVTSSGFSGNVMIEATTNWPSDQADLTGLTSLCPTTVSGDPYHVILNAVVQINYTYFFVNGQPQPDLQSTVLHELGHVMGLDHSCSTTAGVLPLCSSSPSAYQTAVMFPYMTFTGIYGNQNRALQENDEQRVNCLYTASSSATGSGN